MRRHACSSHLYLKNSWYRMFFAVCDSQAIRTLGGQAHVERICQISSSIVPAMEYGAELSARLFLPSVIHLPVFSHLDKSLADVRLYQNLDRTTKRCAAHSVMLSLMRCWLRYDCQGRPPKPLFPELRARLGSYTYSSD